ncbi:MAG: hypothetical protein LBP89_00915 [Helicobacteraceae bacterium]|nr:hypothetical protein [Helicobacteraceae bacterium]
MSLAFAIPAFGARTPSCADPNLSSLIEGMPTTKIGEVIDSGFYLLTPAQKVYTSLDPSDRDLFEAPLLVFCKGLKAYSDTKNPNSVEVYLPLVITTAGASYQSNWQLNGNMVIDYFAGRCNLGLSSIYSSAYEYYHYCHIRSGISSIWGTMAPTLPSGDKLSALRLNMGSLELSVNNYFPFNNINLIGTSLTIDQITMTPSAKYPDPNDYEHQVTNCFNNQLIYGHDNQVVKTNLRTTGQYVRYCALDKLTFKQLNNYRAPIKKRTGNAVKLYESCLDIYNAQKDATDGYYLVNPPANKSVPYVAYCKMPEAGAQSEDNYAKTIFLALESRIQSRAWDTLEDTCAMLGIAYFVPTSKAKFDEMRKFLLDRKPQWEGYTGTINQWYRDMIGNQTSNFPVASVRNNAFWPFGSLGIYHPENGGSWSIFQNKAINSEQMGSVVYNGKKWKSILDPSDNIGQSYLAKLREMDGQANAELPTAWWISDEPISGLKEPSGNYDKLTWLAYVFDSSGNLAYIDDSNSPAIGNTIGNKELTVYSYPHYVCQSLDSYVLASVGVSDDPPVAALAWDSTLEPAKDDPATYTKMAKQTYQDPVTKKILERDDIQIKIAPADVEGYDGLLCARLKIKDLTKKGLTNENVYSKPYSISGSDLNAPVLTSNETADGYKCAAVIKTQNLKTNPIVFSWNDDFIASPEVSVEVLTSNCKTIEQMQSASGCNTNPSTASNFSLRPSFEGGVYEGKLISGKLYGDPSYPLATPPINPLPGGISASATIGYKRNSGAQPCNAGNGLCVQAIDKKPSVGDVSDKADANISFTGIADIGGATKANFHKLGYDNVGEVELWLLDNEWTIIDQSGSNYDCENGSDSTEINFTLSKDKNPNWGKIGCVVRHKIGEVEINPYELNVTKMTIKGSILYESDASYVYYANTGEVNLSANPLNDKKQFAIVEINAEALNAKGGVTDLYSDGNYSKEITHDMILTSFSENDMPTAVIDALWSGYWNETDETADTVTPPSVWQRGKAEGLKYVFNFGREFNKPNPVLFMEAKDVNPDFNLTLTETLNNDVNGSAAWTAGLADEFKRIDFIYGRAHLRDVSTKTDEANVSYVIDYFSDRTGSGGVRSVSAFKIPSALTSRAGWYSIPQYIDGDTKGTISADLGEGTVNKPNTSNGVEAKFEYSADEPRPRRFTSHLDIPSYLWYHPFGKNDGYQKVVPLEVQTRRGCFEHPCGVIEFLTPVIDGWGGIGESDDGRHYDDNSTKNYEPYRLGR